MNIFKFLFRNTARKLTSSAFEEGIQKGFVLGRAYEQSNIKKVGVVMGVNYRRELDSILEKAGF
jgi:hypothetical protein